MKNTNGAESFYFDRVWRKSRSMAQTIRVPLAVLLCAFGWARASAAPVVLAPDGAWCWFGNPKALFKGGILYSSYVRNADGRTALSAFDPKTGVSTELWASGFVSRDDHNNAGLLELNDGRMLAIYAKHHSEKQFYYRLSWNANPVTAADWGPEQICANTTAPVTYSNPFQLRGESGRIYNFTRNLNFNPTYLTSDDSGATWSVPKIFIKVGIGVRPYVQYCSDFDRRIDFLYTDGHPDSVKTSLFHGYYEGGGFYKTDGTFLKNLKDGPLLHDKPALEQGSVIYQYSEKPTTDYNDHIPFGRAWCWDLAYDKNKAPVAVFSVNSFAPDKTVNWADRRLHYYYARWNGSAWTKRLIAQAGAPLYDAAYDYAGGITVDPSNPDVIYLSTNAADPFSLSDLKNVPLRAGNRYEIFRGETHDGGLGFAWEPVTKDSASDNLRPYVPRGNTFPYGVAWFSGKYVSYGTWNTALLGIFDKELKPSPKDPAAVLSLMHSVADWQLKVRLPENQLTNWIQGAGYTGFMALSQLPGGRKYEEAMAGVGEITQWKLGPQCRFHADDMCVGQMYLDLYARLRKPEMIADTRQVLDEFVAINAPEAPMPVAPSNLVSHWTWCDALFMAPAVLAKLHTITGDQKYLDALMREYKRSTDFLFDKEENLYFRDSGYFKKREANGAKVFWGRGNGWVFGGLANVLKSLPKDAPERAYFEAIFQKMAPRIIATQQPDGLWRASLLDPDSFPLKETSASGLFCYGLAWGINSGLLDRATTLPAVEKAWAALAACVTTEGKLTHVQPVGADPGNFKPESTEAYGVGAFLLAGTEVYRLLQPASLRVAPQE